MLPKVALELQRGLPPILFTFENFAPQKTPFLRFFPFLYFFMYFFGIPCLLFRLCINFYPF